MAASALVRELPVFCAMFAFYSNRLGCLGSIALSIVGTLILAMIMWSLSVR
jgi:hypothetical protein